MQGLKRLVLWIQSLILLVDQGMWIQVNVLHCSYAKAASLRANKIVTQERKREPRMERKKKRGGREEEVISSFPLRAHTRGRE